MERKTRNKPGQVGVFGKIGENAVTRGQGLKRSADDNVEIQQSKKTRRAFGDITNRDKLQSQGGKKNLKQKSKLPSKKSNDTSNLVEAVVVIPKTVSGSLSNSQQDRSDTSWEVVELSQPSSQPGSQLSSQDSNSSYKPLELSVDELTLKDESCTDESSVDAAYDDVDKDVTDTFQVPLYAHHIFEYYKERERKMVIRDYMSSQNDLTSSMRGILVDWLVEVQENFELNHETLYLAVKLVDHYLCDNQMTRDKLQLVGATAMFISCKFDERMPPVLDDFLYICDDAYTRDQLLTMERTLLKSVGFDLGYPLSYSFLRRFAKCGRAPLETLTLARYVLEMSLMDYSFVSLPDSKMAAASLLLAMRMKEATVSWDATLEHYTSYTKSDLLPLVCRLNAMIAAPPSKQLATIRTKYSHTVFHEVAKTAPLSTEALASLES